MKPLNSFSYVPVNPYPAVERYPISQLRLGSVLIGVGPEEKHKKRSKMLNRFFLSCISLSSLGNILNPLNHFSDILGLPKCHGKQILEPTLYTLLTTLKSPGPSKVSKKIDLGVYRRNNTFLPSFLTRCQHFELFGTLFVHLKNLDGTRTPQKRSTG